MLQTKDGNVKDSYVRFRLTDNEKQQIKERAKKKHTSMSDYIKNAINFYMQHENE